MYKAPAQFRFNYFLSFVHGLLVFCFRGDKLRIGVCTPVGAEFEIKTNFPYKLTSKSKFTQVDTLEELDTDDDLDGKKFYHDNTTG